MTRCMVMISVVPRRQAFASQHVTVQYSTVQYAAELYYSGTEKHSPSYMPLPGWSGPSASSGRPPSASPPPPPCPCPARAPLLRSREAERRKDKVCVQCAMTCHRRIWPSEHHTLGSNRRTPCPCPCRARARARAGIHTLGRRERALLGGLTQPRGGYSVVVKRPDPYVTRHDGVT